MKDIKKIQEFFSKPLEEVTKSQMLKKAKKGSYPATLVAIENGKVVAQEKVNTPQEAPAAHSVMTKKYPNAKIRLEDSTGKILEEGTFDQGEIAIYMGNDDSGLTHIFKRGSGYYGYNDEFDFEAKDRADLEQKLKSYGYELLAGSLDEATKDEENEFHKELDKLVHKTFGHSSDEKKKMEEEEGYSQFLKDDPEHPGGKTKGLTPDVLNKILMNVIKDLDELKQLGEGMIEEELCPKGKAYIKKRQAAGEKSSAYLSGRAVKVCKGQMKG